MSIKYAILGFLSRTPLTGYDLKKRFAESETLYWSGNNNQIYRTLVKLHEQNLVTKEVEQQADRPPRKIYTITDKGLSELKQWVSSTPELPQLRNPFLIQLAWADQIEASDLNDLLAKYEEEVDTKLLMLREQEQRDRDSPGSVPREIYLRDTIRKYWISFYERELDWVRKLARELHQA